MDNLSQKIKDLQFLLRREKMENKTRIKEILYQILEAHDSLQHLGEIASRQQWPDECHQFVAERFGLIGKMLLQILRRSGADELNSLGQPHNCEHHEIVAEVSCPNVRPGEIVEVQQDGYLFGGELLRMAKVVVASRPDA